MRRLELGGVLDLVLRLAEDDAEHGLRRRCRGSSACRVVGFEGVAVEGDEAGPVVPGGNEGGLVVGRLRPLVGHLEEEQVGQLLDVIAVGEAVVTEEVAVVPELLDKLLRVVNCHLAFVRFCWQLNL